MLDRLVSQGGSDGELPLRRRATAPATVCQHLLVCSLVGDTCVTSLRSVTLVCRSAGWTVDTVDADSHDNWAAYHVLKAHGQKLVDGDLFADIKRATDRGLNKHRTVVSEEDGKKSEEEKRKREEEGEEGEGEEYE